LILDASSRAAEARAVSGFDPSAPFPGEAADHGIERMRAYLARRFGGA